MSNLSPRAQALRDRCPGIALTTEQWEAVAGAVEDHVAREIAKSTLGILCSVRDSGGFSGNALKDVEWAIEGQRYLLKHGVPPADAEKSEGVVGR